MKILEFFRGLPQVALHEVVGNLKSIRFVIMALVSTLVIVGGSYGFSGFGGGFGGPPQMIVWGHAAFAPNGSHVAVVWVSDPFGAPLSNRVVQVLEGFEGAIVAEAETDGDGYVRLDVGSREQLFVTARSGTVFAGTAISFFPPPVGNFTTGIYQGDLDSDQRFDELGIHVVNRTGIPLVARVLVNGTEVATTDAPTPGYALIDLPEGSSNVTVAYGGEEQTFSMLVSDGGELPFSGGPDSVLSLISGLSILIVSMFAIVVSFDAISKERVQGTLDLLLSRPASRSGILLGKFLGAFAAVAFPVTLVNLAGIAAITAASGQGPTGSYAAAFVGFSVLLIAFFVLLQLIFSTFAKTSGTAILFGVLLWLLLNLLYPIVTLVLGGILFPTDFAGRFRFQQAADLGNPSSVVGLLISLHRPEDVFSPFGQTTLEIPTVATAAIVWFVLLLGLALWVFHKKAAE